MLHSINLGLYNVSSKAENICRKIAVESYTYHNLSLCGRFWLHRTAERGNRIALAKYNYKYGWCPKMRCWSRTSFLTSNLELDWVWKYVRLLRLTFHHSCEVSGGQRLNKSNRIALFSPLVDWKTSLRCSRISLYRNYRQLEVCPWSSIVYGCKKITWFFWHSQSLFAIHTYRFKTLIVFMAGLGMGGFKATSHNMTGVLHSIVMYMNPSNQTLVTSL